MADASRGLVRPGDPAARGDEPGADDAARRPAVPDRLTLVAVIADTHLPRGSRRLPDACVRRLEEADLILHAGDFTASSVLEELERYAPVAAVYGNMDEAAMRGQLPAQQVVEVGGVRIGMTHYGGPAAGRAERLAARFPDCDAVIYGHSHIPEVTRHGAVWILNPGSPTERRRAPEHTMILLRIHAARVAPEIVTL